MGQSFDDDEVIMARPESIWCEKKTLPQLKDDRASEMKGPAKPMFLQTTTEFKPITILSVLSPKVVDSLQSLTLVHTKLDSMVKSTKPRDG